MLEEIIKFKNSIEWLEFEKYFSESSLMEQVDLFRFEDANTNFLASLLKQDNIYGLNYYPITAFIELIACKNDKCLPLLKLFNARELKITDIQLRKKLESGYPDLYIEFERISDKKDKYAIVLEAKLSSDEHDNQCNNYKKEFDEKKEYTDVIFVYLTLDGSLPPSSQEDYIPITYQDLLSNIYEPCYFKSSNNTLLHEYIKGFLSLYKQTTIDQKSIPITHDGEQLTTTLWNEHKDFILKLLKNSKDDILGEFYKTNKSIINILFINLYILSDKLNIDSSLKSKLYTRIKQTSHKFMFDEKPYGNSDFMYEVFKDIIDTYEIIDPDNLSEINVTTSNWRNIIPSSQIADEPKKEWYRLNKMRSYQEPLNINGVQYYYCYSNNNEDIRKFIARVIEVYPDYKDRIYEIGGDE